MGSPIEIVSGFCAQWDESMDRTRAAIRRHFTPDTLWDNVGLAVTKGPEEAISLWESFEKFGFIRIRVDMLNIAAVGETVLTERVDHLIGLDGKILLSARLMGAFELQGEKIKRWTDYVDPAVLAALTRTAS